MDPGARVGDAVESLRPPLVRRHGETGNAGGCVDELLGFFREGEEREEVVGSG